MNTPTFASEMLRHCSSMSRCFALPAPALRAQIFVNGFQFGKYVNHVGPQTDVLLPQGILNYSGRNCLTITVWSQSASAWSRRAAAYHGRKAGNELSLCQDGGAI
ncbi:hypothetical protein VHEMI08278 [[Torrubiella] hemipterigena]|uniref:Beta-galactosidase jelly roll domain-containing protein n=1 Tax=[Torrubiella] hemipterigena TaxID=1531966 RepID=A0A0A1TMX6_9HYPO|nr:hypothetical protein VHEMI08278 [[Torrubiella] hemipterigena]